MYVGPFGLTTLFFFDNVYLRSLEPLNIRKTLS